MLLVNGVVGVDQDVIEVDEYTYIQEIGEDIVHETEESSRSIGEAERHNTPLEGSIASTEGGLPFVSFMDPNKMVCMPEIDLSKESGLPRAIQEVRDAGRWVTVFLCDSVEALKVNTKSKGPILFLMNRTGAPHGERVGWITL